ncbi:MAG: histidinol dehydrogenase [bacterium]
MNPDRFTLRRRNAGEVSGTPAEPLAAEILEGAGAIVAEVAAGGDAALERLARRFDGKDPDAPLVHGREALVAALGGLEPGVRGLLERVAGRIASFAAAQRASLRPVVTEVPGGRAGHDLIPVDAAGCYAPGGRHPLPSSVLMTVVTARAAGVPTVIACCPRPDPVVLAAAAIAGADSLVAAGGAHAIGALAHGTDSVPACQAIVGPGNVWVTAAKRIVSSWVRTDGEAGPSELVVVADASCDPELVAADLIAQAEHDVLARTVLVSLDETLILRVEESLARRLDGLPTAATARAALTGGFAVLVGDQCEAVELCNRLAPEHLQWMAAGGRRPAGLRHYGGLFLGAGAAEVLGDYGAGPNHVLPTAGQARLRGGLSVLDFLKVQTWLQVDDPGASAGLAEDARDLARLEGLEGHARAAGLRIPAFRRRA